MIKEEAPNYQVECVRCGTRFSIDIFAVKLENRASLSYSEEKRQSINQLIPHIGLQSA